ncbi:MAG: AMP-binding protein [Oscillospiraceae bacterium]|nr:AMP-binding protein [Oscillospiraceae bacterium]
MKIRGFRIELGEIESCLRQIPGVKDCAVIVRKDKNGDSILCAFIVYAGDALTNETVRDNLEKKLPDYMIPSHIAAIDAIPVNKNGKVDIKALPEIETSSSKEYAAPRSETERIVCDAFVQVLGAEQVGIHDSFFELGGHSLKATRLVNEIESLCGLRIALKEVFGNQTPEKLAKLIEGAAGESYKPIPEAEEKESYEMTPTQRRTYLIACMDEGSTAYNMPQILRLEGKVDAEKVRSALQQMIDRHEILRTQFLMADGRPVQHILEHVEAEFEAVRDNETDTQSIMDEFMRPFDLSKPPLVRMKLVERAAWSLLFMDMHHIVSDGASDTIFTNEFTALYNGEELEAPRQFKDYSEWLNARDLSAQEKFWTDTFSGEIPVLEMPLDHPRPIEQSHAGNAIVKSLDPELLQGVRQLAADTGATEYMVFLSAIMILLSKYSRQEDIVVGSPITGRIHRDTEKMLGMFVNTLAMRGHPAAGKRYCDFLKEVKETCLKAYENQEYPFDELVEKVNVRRDLSRNPLFDVMFALQNNELTTMELTGTKAEEEMFRNDCMAKFDLTFNVLIQEDKYSVELEYCTAIFEKESAELLIQHLEAILEAIAREPERKLGELSTAVGSERERVLKEFNATDWAYEEKTITELFEEQVRKTPDNKAVMFGETELSYQQLNERANAVACRLRELGVGPDDFVAILARRSIEMIAAIYGVLKSGGAYVPIDPDYPEYRKQYILGDCKPKAILVSGVEIETDIPQIDLSDREVWLGAAQNPEHVNKPGDLAYVIYTSGTTGRPKGVLVEHGGISSLKVYFDQKFSLGNGDKVQQFANYVFDGSVSILHTLHFCMMNMICIFMGFVLKKKVNATAVCLFIVVLLSSLIGTLCTKVEKLTPLYLKTVPVITYTMFGGTEKALTVAGSTLVFLLITAAIFYATGKVFEKEELA